MTSAARDLSNYGGAPVDLYEFTRASVPTLSSPVTTVWRYTSNDRDYSFGGNTYKAIAISNDGIRQTGSGSQDTLEITMPALEDVPAMFAGAPPSDPIQAVISRTHDGESDRFIQWAGLVGSVTRSDDLVARIACGTIGATLDRTGLRLAYSRMCPYVLYQIGCNVNPALFAMTGTVISVGGVFISANEWAGTFPRLRGGYVEWLDALGHAERRGIIDQSADGIGIRVMGVVGTNITIGQTAWVFPGCPHNPDGCLLFDNLPNYGGHPYMVSKSPFSGDVIF